MPKLVVAYTKDVERIATKKPPYGPGFPKDVAEQADRLEAWRSWVYDAKPVKGTEYRLFKGSELLASKVVSKN